MNKKDFHIPLNNNGGLSKVKLRRYLNVVMGVFIAAFLLTPHFVFAQSRSVYWERWDVIIDEINTTNNSFRVTEEYDIRFAGSFSFGSAVIPYTNLEDIEDLEVYENNRALRQSCSGSRGTYCATREGNDLSIVYYFFEPLNNAQRSFEISYTVIGGLRIYEGGDQLWWNAIPSEHYGFSIGSALIKVTLPNGFAPREGVDPVETYGAPADVVVRGTNITARALGTLDGDDYFYIRIQYPHDSDARVANWQAEFDQQQAFNENVAPLLNIGILALSLLIGLGLPLFIYTRYLRAGRDPEIGPIPTYLAEPPSTMPPALVGALVDERADLRDVMSTILDLGQRGYLVIEETQTAGIFGIGKSSTYTFKRTDKPINEGELLSFERRLLTNLFTGNRMERSLDSLRTVFYTVIQQMQNDLYNELVKAEFFKANPNTTRGLWQFYAFALLILSIFLGFILFTTLAESLGTVLCIPFGLFLGAVTAFIVSPAMPAKTRKGAEEATKWLAFVEYLRNLEKYADISEATDKFDNYLPYAVAAGIDRSWVQRFHQIQDVPIPTWYYPTYLGRYRGGYVAGTPLSAGNGRSGRLPGDLARAGEGGFSLDDLSGNLGGALENISSGLTNMLESAGRIMTSVPQPSNSSGRWSSGGRSWSGGGRSFSGGGSGGGSRGFG
jgi:uncharacterized membrane protein